MFASRSPVPACRASHNGIGAHGGAKSGPPLDAGPATTAARRSRVARPDRARYPSVVGVADHEGNQRGRVQAFDSRTLFPLPDSLHVGVRLSIRRGE